MRKSIKGTFGLFLSLAMVSSAFTPAFGSSQNTDYGNHWAQSTIQSAMDSGVVRGYPNGSFKPDTTITRAEFFKMINSAFKFTDASTPIYSDVASTAWYAPVVGVTNKAGYISGYVDGSIHPDDRITRQEVAVIISRLKPLAVSSDTLHFTDADMIPDWSKNAIKAAFDAKVMVGYPNGKFMPEGQITRAEALVALNNCLNYQVAAQPADLVYDMPGSYGPSEGLATIEGNVVVKVPGVTLKNAVVKGNITFGSGINDGSATLKDVTVKGNIYTSGGMTSSVYLENVQSESLMVIKGTGPVEIVASGTTTIGKVRIVSDVKLEETNLTGAGFQNIGIEKEALYGTSLTLVNVVCNLVSINGAGVILNIDKGTTLSALTIDAVEAKIKGAGIIKSIVETVSGATFESTIIK